MDKDFIRHLIGALRGGHETVIDRKTGKTTDRYWSTAKGKKPEMPKNLREYQLHNQEAMLGLQPKKTYSEWSEER